MAFVQRGTTNNNKKRAHHANRQAPVKSPRSQTNDSMQWYEDRKDSKQSKGPRKKSNKIQNNPPRSHPQAQKNERHQKKTLQNIIGSASNTRMAIAMQERSLVLCQQKL